MRQECSSLVRVRAGVDEKERLTSFRSHFLDRNILSDHHRSLNNTSALILLVDKEDIPSGDSAVPAEDDEVDVGLETNADDDRGNDVGAGRREDVVTTDPGIPEDFPMHSAFAIVKFNHDPEAGLLVKALYQ